jgi:hypothetical protein
LYGQPTRVAGSIAALAFVVGTVVLLVDTF